MGSGEAAQILVERERRETGLVARLTVDNQAKLNVLDSRLTDALRRAVEGLAGEAELRAVVLTGAGSRAFIGGADIRELAALTPATARSFITGLHALCAALQALPVPVIARIQGYCLGAGLEIAASCDLRAAAEDARFAMPEVRVGIPSVIEAALLPRLVGMGRAQELVLTGREVAAEEALSIGLVERVVPAAELDGAIEDWLEALLAAGPQALAAQKKLAQDWRELPLSQSIARSIDAFAQAFEDAEPATMMRAFLERKR
ncbi:MAG: enoyl-CoA hydratase/isomerase family protein [Proteobacteria bacterium]|nr:enoyl-CoA hydratase/isomerase family protein [Pseudomonadota bacterium]